jgi:hypothetical protein
VGLPRIDEPAAPDAGDEEGAGEQEHDRGLEAERQPAGAAGGQERRDVGLGHAGTGT